MSQNLKYLAIEVGLLIAFNEGIEAVTLQSVADRLNVSRQAIGHHYTIDQLREAVERTGIDRGVIPVIAQAITGARAARHPVTPAQFRAVANWLEGRANAQQ